MTSSFFKENLLESKIYIFCLLSVTPVPLPVTSPIQCIQGLSSGTGEETTAHTCMKLGRHVTHTYPSPQAPEAVHFGFGGHEVVEAV